MKPSPQTLTKTFFIVTSFLFTCSFTSAQKAANTPASRSFPEVIDAVLRDFPNNLQHITGDLVLAQGEIENYASTVSLRSPATAPSPAIIPQWTPLSAGRRKCW